MSPTNALYSSAWVTPHVVYNSISRLSFFFLLTIERSGETISELPTQLSPSREKFLPFESLRVPWTNLMLEEFEIQMEILSSDDLNLEFRLTREISMDLNYLDHFSSSGFEEMLEEIHSNLRKTKSPYFFCDYLNMQQIWETFTGVKYRFRNL